MVRIEKRSSKIDDPSDKEWWIEGHLCCGVDGTQKLLRKKYIALVCSRCMGNGQAVMMRESMYENKM